MKIVCDECGANIHIDGGSEAAAELLAKHKVAEHTSVESENKGLLDRNFSLALRLTRACESLQTIAAGDMAKAAAAQEAQTALEEISKL